MTKTTVCSVCQHAKDKQYYQIYPGSPRKTWSDLPLAYLGADGFRKPDIEKINSAEIKEIGILPRNGVQGPGFFSGDHVCQSFKRVGGHHVFLSSGTVYHLNIEFSLTTDSSPFRVCMSSPWNIASDREISGDSRKVIRSFLDKSKFCSRYDKDNPQSFVSLFTWVARTTTPTMSASDFIKILGRSTFEYFLDQKIILKDEHSEFVLCDRIKDHCCTQEILENPGDASFPFSLHCRRFNENKPLRLNDIQRYTVTEVSFLDFLGRVFGINRKDLGLNKDAEGVFDLGNIIWRNKKTRLLFCYQTWRPRMDYYLSYKTSHFKRTLIVSPARWITPESFEKDFHQKGQRELIFMEDMFEFRKNKLVLSENYNKIEEDTVTLPHVSYATVFDHSGSYDINKKEYDKIVEDMNDYDLFLDCRSKIKKRYKYVKRMKGKSTSILLREYEASPIARLVVNRGRRMDPKVLLPDSRASAYNVFRQVSKIRSKVDFKLNGDSSKRGAVWKCFHTENGLYFFEPPLDARYVLILPVDYQRSLLSG